MGRLTKAALVYSVLLICGSSGCTPPPPSLSRDESGWWIYRNAKYGYRIGHPEGYELWATGPEGERDGRSIRIGIENYAAPTPVLDVVLGPAVRIYETLAAGKPPKDMRVEVRAIEMGGGPARLVEFRWKSTGDLAIVEIHGPDVLFQFHAQPGLREFRGTIWWQIVSSFQFDYGR